MNVSVLHAYLAKWHQTPPIPANKGSATDKFKFLFFENFFWIFRISLMSALNLCCFCSFVVMQEQSLSLKFDLRLFLCVLRHFCILGGIIYHLNRETP